MQEVNNISSNLVQDILKERRSDRRWKNIRFIVWVALILFLILWIRSFFRSSVAPVTPVDGKYVALIRLDGMIAPGKDFSAEEVVPLLEEAMTDKKAAGVVLDINSGGGTPVQAAIIHDAIFALKKKYHKKVVIVGEDLLTSGAYYVSVAADKIYVNPNTITGSIGVVMKGFGFVDLLKKMGIERRVYFAGAEKDRLDPFLPQSQEDIDKIHQVMNEVHVNFTRVVLEGRKGKLHADPKILFSGDFWSGETAFKLGLVDGLGNLLDVMEKEFNTTEYREFAPSPSLLRLITGQVTTALDMLFYL